MVECVARAQAAVVAIVDIPVTTRRYFANAFVAVSAIGLIHGVVGSAKITTMFPGIAQPFAFHGARQTKYAEIARLLISQFPSWLIKCTKNGNTYIISLNPHSLRTYVKTRRLFIIYSRA